jgi:hypothetical protein
VNVFCIVVSLAKKGKSLYLYAQILYLEAMAVVVAVVAVFEAMYISYIRNTIDMQMPTNQ